MGSRAIQLALIIVIGAGLGLLIARPWGAEGPDEALAPQAASDVPMTPKPQSEPLAASTAAQEGAASAAVVPPPTRTFKLPAVAAAIPAAAAKPKEEAAKRPLPPLLVPRHWLLRGTGPSGYDVKSDRAEVFTGQASVQLVSHDKNIAATKFGSLLQTVAADPWVGKRVEFSMSTKSRELRAHFDVWIRATDAGGAVIAHDHFEALYVKPEWKKAGLIMDIPWSAAEISYGISLHGAGVVWVDDAQFKVVDKSIELTGRSRPGDLGVLVQAADRNGPLAMPANLDFEDVVAADETFRELPADELGKARR